MSPRRVLPAPTLPLSLLCIHPYLFLSPVPIVPSCPQPGPSQSQEVGWPRAGQRQAREIRCKVHPGTTCPQSWASWGPSVLSSEMRVWSGDSH